MPLEGCERLKTLYIIGNGFDLAHGIKSAYGDFRKFEKEKGNGHFVEMMEVFFSNSTEFCSDVETALGDYDEDSIIDYCNPNPEFDYDHPTRSEAAYCDSPDFIFQPLLEQLTADFRTWVEAIDLGSAKRLMSLSWEARYLTFNYTDTLETVYGTPAEIAPLVVQEFGEVTPVASEPLEKLEAFKVMLAPYEFENTFYYPEFLSSAAEGYNVVSVVDATDNSEVTSFKVDIKWDTDNNYWLENIEPLDVTLFEGRSYEVRVPAGMVCCRYDPIRELTANKDFAVTYNGGYSPNCEFTYSVSGLSDVTTTVAKGSTVTVNVAPAENFKVESVAFNGEDVELSGDSFTTPALDSDEALLEVTFAYDGTILFDFTTGVEDIADCPFKVWSNDDHIVIENVTVGADIKVYSVAGVLIADTTATDEVVNISVLPGVYVVVIDGVGLKVKH